LEIRKKIEGFLKRSAISKTLEFTLKIIMEVILKNYSLILKYFSRDFSRSWQLETFFYRSPGDDQIAIHLLQRFAIQV